MRSVQNALPQSNDHFKFRPFLASIPIISASGPTAITPLFENYRLHPTDHFTFRIFKGLSPLSRESGNRPLKTFEKNKMKSLQCNVSHRQTFAAKKVSNKKPNQNKNKSTFDSVGVMAGGT